MFKTGVTCSLRGYFVIIRAHIDSEVFAGDQFYA